MALFTIGGSSARLREPVAGRTAELRTTNFGRAKTQFQQPSQRLLEGGRQPARPYRGRAAGVFYVERPDVQRSSAPARADLPDGDSASVSLCDEPEVCDVHGAHRAARRDSRSSRFAGRRIFPIPAETAAETRRRETGARTFEFWRRRGAGEPGTGPCDASPGAFFGGETSGRKPAGVSRSLGDWAAARARDSASGRVCAASGTASGWAACAEDSSAASGNFGGSFARSRNWGREGRAAAGTADR